MINFKEHSLILFDGVCNLCNSSIQLIIKNDKKDHFLFASLQSDAGQQFLLQNNRENLNFESILLIEDGQVYEKSEAVLRICRRLSGGFPLLYGLRIIPRILRDFIYDKVAKYRYKWFGKQDVCMMPSKDLKMKFLD